MTELNREPIRVSIENSAGWVIQTNTSGVAQNVVILSGFALIGTVNTIAIGAGNSVTVTNSGGLYAMQSGAWSISSTILNSAGWVVNVSNTANRTVIVNNSGGLFAQQSGAWAVSSTILNSAGWVVNVSNTANRTVIINNSGGLFAQQSGSWVVTIANTGGTILSQTIANTAGWVVYAIDSSSTGSVVTSIASTIGNVTLAASNTKRVNLSVYNSSINPLYLKLGASASTSSYTLLMVASGYYELPRPIYNGIITGIWNSANGVALVTETT